MKVRSGFVSNSSSSSFILVFDSKPSSVEELVTVLGDRTFTDGWGETEYSTLELAQVIFYDLNRSDKDLDETLLQEFKNKTYLDLWYETGRFNDDESDKRAKAELEKFKKKTEGKFVAVVNYSDNDGSMYCTLHSGEVFSNIEHIRVSHH